MPKSTLQWDFHDDPVQLPDDPDPTRRPRASFPWRRLTVIVLIGAILLGVAGLAGFGFGRYQRSTTAARTDLQAAVDLETWAWQSGNRQVFVSTLDLAGRPDWRRDVERQFEAIGKEIRSVSLRGFRFVDDSLVEVQVDVADATGTRQETRYYRLVQNQWRRTAPPPK